MACGLVVLAAYCLIDGRADRAEQDEVLTRELVREQARFVDATLNAVAASARTIVAALSAERQPENAGRLLEEAAHQPIVSAALLADDRGRVVAARWREALPVLPALQFKEIGARRNWAGAALLRGEGPAGGETYLAVAVCTPDTPGVNRVRVQLVVRAGTLAAATGASPRIWLLESGSTLAAGSGDAERVADTAALLRRWVSVHPAPPRGFLDVAMADGDHRLYFERLTEWPMTLIFDSGMTPAFGVRSQDILGFLLMLTAAALVWLALRGKHAPTAGTQSVRITDSASSGAVLNSFDSQQGARLLAGIVAHEIGDLLTVVSCDAEMAAELAAGDIAFRRLSRSMLAATERGADFVQVLLSYAEKQLLRPQSIDLGRELAARRGELATNLLPGQRLALNLPANARHRPLIEVDHSALTRSLVAMLRHVAQAAAPMATIEIAVELAASDSGTMVELTVEATASADGWIDGSEGVRHETINPEIGDLHLGLAAASGFARQSDGGLELAVRLGGGPLARLFFPLKPAQRRAAPHIASLGLPRLPMSARTPRRPLRILLVDNSAPVRESIARRLQSLGFEVIEASGAADAEAMAARGMDVLLTEIVLGGGVDGWTIAELVRRQMPGLPVLFMTGFMVAAETACLRGDELTQFIRKPIDGEDLLAVIHGLLALRETRMADAAD